jgi:DNA anti-recombination protein RmuC
VLALAQQLATVAAGLSAEQQAARAKVQAIEQQLAQLASQFANRPER